MQNNLKIIPNAQEYIDLVQQKLAAKADPVIATAKAAYMKNRFAFYGIPSPERRQVQREVSTRFQLPKKMDGEIIIRNFWQRPQREYQYISQELAAKYVKQFEKPDIKLIEFMIQNKSWWDTIDFIAPNLVGKYFKTFPEQRDPIVQKWLDSNNMWLQRSAVLFQLKYKTELDTKLLTHIIHSLLGSKEFFINKAIGWILREYGKTNPDWVVGFVDNTQLENLSRREALKLL